MHLGLSVCLSAVCLSVLAHNSNTIAPIDLIFYIILMARSSSTIIWIPIRIQEFIKGFYAIEIGKKYAIKLRHDVKNAL